MLKFKESKMKVYKKKRALWACLFILFSIEPKKNEIIIILMKKLLKFLTVLIIQDEFLWPIIIFIIKLIIRMDYWIRVVHEINCIVNLKKKIPCSINENIIII